ncbi:MAG: hypothetical protein IPI34_11110 [bacterium]|nr:hypothetical protein [bacterium]
MSEVMSPVLWSFFRMMMSWRFSRESMKALPVQKTVNQPSGWMSFASTPYDHSLWTVLSGLMIPVNVFPLW